MSRIHVGSLLVLFLVASLLSPAAESATEQREWRFTALLDGKVIGYQPFAYRNKVRKGTGERSTIQREIPAYERLYLYA